MGTSHLLQHTSRRAERDTVICATTRYDNEMINLSQFTGYRLPIYTTKCKNRKILAYWCYAGQTGLYIVLFRSFIPCGDVIICFVLLRQSELEWRPDMYLLKFYYVMCLTNFFNWWCESSFKGCTVQTVKPKFSFPWPWL